MRELNEHVVDTLGYRGDGLIRQMIWRDFFYNVTFHFPETFTEHAMKYFPWRNDKEDFEKWCEGKTGFPFVDAGMR